uniref:Lipocalin/cytosolic fatty-acid binding domain-containing protein n=1 Tax=Mus spicilegus TaxID=10103 RepID=A0A8C6GMF6_MUSSI
MALHMALVMLSLLLLLEAQNPELANITIGDPINNETLSWLSDKWFLIGVASRNPEVQQSIQEKMTVFLHLTLNLIKDTVEIQEYDTLGDQCEYYSNHLGFQKENGTLSLYGEGVDSRLSGRVLQGYKGTAEQCS